MIEEYFEEDDCSEFVHDIIEVQMKLSTEIVQMMTTTAISDELLIKTRIHEDVLELVLRYVSNLVDWDKNRNGFDNSFDLCDLWSDALRNAAGSLDFKPEFEADVDELLEQRNLALDEELVDQGNLAYDEELDKEIDKEIDALTKEMQRLKEDYNSQIEHNNLQQPQQTWSFYSRLQLLVDRRRTTAQPSDSTSCIKPLKKLNPAKIREHVNARAHYNRFKLYLAAETRFLVYSDQDTSKTAVFNLQTQLQSLKAVGGELEPRRSAKSDHQNCLVPLMVFVVSDKAEGSHHFVTVELPTSLGRERLWLDYHAGDKSKFRERVLINYNAGQRLTGLAEMTKTEFKKKSDQDINHSEHVLSDYLRESTNQALKKKIREIYGQSDCDKFTVDACVLLLYSTNSVCLICASS